MICGRYRPWLAYLSRQEKRRDKGQNRKPWLDLFAPVEFANGKYRYDVDIESNGLNFP